MGSRRLAPLAIWVALGLGACAGGLANGRPDVAPAPRVRAGAALSAGAGPPLCPLEDPDHVDPRRPRPLSAGSLLAPEVPVRVHYCAEALRPLAERLLPQAASSYRRLLSLGFAAPLGDGDRGGGPELDIYLSNLGRGGRAQANDEPAGAADRTAPGYVTIDYRTPEAHDFLASYAAHEMSHVMQYALGRKTAEPFMEATAAYLDDRLYPAADILPAMVADFQRAPDRPISFHDPGSCYDYGAALLAGFLVQRFGDGILPAIFAADQADYLAGLSSVLVAHGSSLDEVLREFARARTRTGRYHRDGDLPGGQRFPEVALDRAISPFDFMDRPLAVRPQKRPQQTGAVYLGIDLTTPLGGGLAIEVTADRGPSRLAAELLSSDQDLPLDSALLSGGERQTLRATALRPGVRLWLAVVNLGPGLGRLRPDTPERTAQGFTARFARLPEPR